MKLLGKAVSVIAVICVAACGSDRLAYNPFAPTPVVAVPSSPSGTVAIVSSVPGAGTTINTRYCNPTGIAVLCTDQLRLAFEVVVDRDVPEATLFVQFTNGASRCAVARSAATSLKAGQLTTIEISSVQLSEGEGSFCTLPATTTRLQAAIASVIGQFDREYTFAEPQRP